ncbi:MAG: Npt1/Npt2 family nucleotide transporter [Vicinamibacteraceae bacterium]
MGRLLRRLLGPIVDVSEQESVTLVMMFAYSFLAMTAYNILKPITRSQFISQLGADNIPYIPLVAAFAIGVIMQGYSRAAGIIPPKWVIPVAQGAMAGILVGFWVLFQTGNWMVAAGFYFFGLIMGILLISQFWTLANEIYDARQAKRLFGFIGAGASLGGIAGSSLLTFSTKAFGTNNLLLVSAALLGVAALLVLSIEARSPVQLASIAKAGEEKGVGGGEALRMLRESRHLQVISLVIAFGAIGAYLIEQQLNMAAEAFKGRTAVDSLTAFLGTVQLYTSIAGFLIQVLATSRIHRLLGIGFALLILPVSLGTSAAIMLANAALWAPSLARVFDTSLRYTVDKTTREILFLPLPGQLKRQAKPFVDVTVDRTAKGVGGLLALLLIAPWGLNLDWQHVSYASLVVCGLWIFTAVKAKQGYINAFRQGLARGDVEPEAHRLATADASTIETLVAELADPDEARVRYAIDVLESLDKRNLITPLLLYHESPKVRARALGALSAAPREVAAKWRSGVQRMLGDESAEVRAAAVGALATLGGEAQVDLARPYLDDANPRIAATAAVVLAGSASEADRELAERALARLSGASGDRHASRREVAIALRQIRDPRTSMLLVPLLNDANPVVATEAMRTVRERGQGDFLFVPALVSLLRHRILKAPARDVLVGYGEEVVPALAHFLRDPEEDVWVRRHLPSTLSRIPCQAAMDVLVAALVGEKDPFLRYKCVAAVDRLHREHPELTFDPSPIETLAWLEGMQYYQFLSYYDNLFIRGGITVPCLLKSLLDEKRARAKERVFFMLGLLYPRRDVMAARWELEHGDARAKASASEYLDNVLSGPLRRRLMPMLEDLPDEERVTRGNVILRTRPRDVEETLLILINSDDEVVSAAAIDLVGRLELRTLADDLDHVLAHRDVRNWHVFEAASWTMAGLRLKATKRRALWLEPLPSVEIASRLRAIPIFASVATDELFRIARTGRQVRLDPGHTLYEAGSLPSHIYLLLDGHVRATARDGEARDVAHPSPLGLEEMLEERPHPETVRATETSVALQLAADEARGLLADNTDLVQGLFRWMLDHPAFGTGRLVLRGTADVPREGGSIVDTGPPPDASQPGGLLRPIDVVLALRRIPVFARSAVEARLALAAISHEERLEPNGVLVHASDPPAIRVVVEGELEAQEPGGEPMTICPGDAVGVLETCAGLPIGANIRVTLPGRALRISHEDFFDLLGQRADLLQSLFATLFGARRAEWGLAGGESPGAAPVRELV